MHIEVSGLNKKFKNVHAVKDVKFSLEPGKVTGFLGPNGSGKSTTMKLMVGLEHGDGNTLFDGKKLAEYDNASKIIGTHFGSQSFYPNRSAESHLKLLAKTRKLNKKDEKKLIEDMIELVGLTSARKKKPKQYSLGMVQRLGLAAAILHEPKVLMLDEPANGLDPQSIQWLRTFLQDYAKKGNIVFVSSHLLSEMELLADELVIIAAGEIKATASMQDFISSQSKKRVIVSAPKVAELKKVLKVNGFSFKTDKSNSRLVIQNVDSTEIGRLCSKNMVALDHLEQAQDTLEDVFLSLTSKDQQFATKGSKE